jgi:PAS domain S-box-containing protein
MSVTQEISRGTDRTTRRKLQFKAPLAATLGYGLAIVSVSIATISALILRHFHIDVKTSLFVFAVSVVAWYGGRGPVFAALILSALSANYFFIPPLYTFGITPPEIPYFIVFILFTSLASWFSMTCRRAVEELRYARDELEVRVAERTQQANLLNLAHDTIFVRDMNDVITFWNLGAQELYGWTAEQAIGKRAHELLHTRFPTSLREIHRELLRTGRWDGQLEKSRADGTRVIVSSRWSLQRDEQGQPTAILATNNDITERKRREQQIHALNEDLSNRTAELESSNKELEAFAYSISHDLRAPLRHMAGYTELLYKHASSAFDEKSQRYMVTILSAAKKMGTLIDDLLAFSRIGRAEARATNVSLQHLVQELSSEVPEPDGRKIDWKISKLPEVYGDRSMLRLALVNLISNAIKFSRTRSQPQIEIGCAEKKNNRVVVFVKDNGVGFDMKYANKLFGVFQRLHSSEAFEGTGIGLATVQRIIHRHGGRVWAESAVDKGATFYFSVPTQRP